MFLLPLLSIRRISLGMSEKQTGFPERYTLGIPEPVRALGRAVSWLFSMHQLSSRSDHFQHEDSLASPVEPVTSWPLESDGVDPHGFLYQGEEPTPRTWEDYRSAGHEIIEHAHPQDAA